MSAVSDGAYIYLIGGDLSGGPSLTFWRYNPVTDSYATNVMPLYSTDTTRQSAVYLNGKIYKVGGHSNDPGGESFAVEVYTVATDQWSQDTDYPAALEESC